ncbi:unnamed protein product [Peniophora sp. CBMAI 1063]|nr:unnamed protein product [Peniophora sp. CBMAI 1063]
MFTVAGVGVTSPGGTTTAAPVSITEKCIDHEDYFGCLTKNYVNHLKEDTDWKAKDLQVRGALLLCCIPAISNKLRKETCAFNMWVYLKKEYGTSGTAGVYNVFLQFLYATIPAKGNLLQTIERIDQHVCRMAELGVEIPQFIHAMVLLSKLPSYMKFVQQLSKDKELGKMDPDEIKSWAMNTYQAEYGAPKASRSDGVQKITAVHRNNGAPQFQQQRGCGGGCGRGCSQQQSSSHDSDTCNKDNTKQRTRKRSRGRGRGRGGFGNNNNSH